MPFCSKCGTEVPENVGFCQKCGNSLQGGQNPNQSSNAVANADPELDMENKKKNFKRIIEGCALLLCVLFFVCPLVKCSYGGEGVSGWEIATSKCSSGSYYKGRDGGFQEGKDPGGELLVFALIIIPAVLLILAHKGKSFTVLCKVSMAGLVAEIIFLIAAYLTINDYKGALKLTGGNWFILGIYIGLVYFTRYCVKEITEKENDENNFQLNEKSYSQKKKDDWLM